MSMTIRVRAGKIKDGKQVVNLWKELRDYSRSISTIDFELTEDSPKKWLKFYEAHVKSKNMRALAAEEKESDEIVGYLLGSIKKRPPIFKTAYHGFISDIYVTAAKRKESGQN
ncbi:MAG: hypothetical protein AB1485_00890 [Candidatus Thermoplasmatota archaeon]